MVLLDPTTPPQAPHSEGNFGEGRRDGVDERTFLLLIPYLLLLIPYLFRLPQDDARVKSMGACLGRVSALGSCWRQLSPSSLFPASLL